jgi:integrase
MSKRLSVAAIERIKPTDKRQEIPDAGQPGLHLIVQPEPSGKKSWAVRYRRNGASRKLTLSGVPAISLKLARTLAQDALNKVAAGRDPAEEKQAERKQPARGITVEEVFADFLAKHVRKRNSEPIRETTRRETGRLLGLVPNAVLTIWAPTKDERGGYKGVLARWHGRAIDGITKRDVLDLLDSKARTAPVEANRMLAALKTAFTWAVKRDILKSSPCDHVDDPGPETRSKPRELSDVEITVLWRAADGMGYPYGRMIQLLLLTGQRRDEVRAAVWSEFNLPAATWTLPGSRTKNGHEHYLPLSTSAVALLKRLPRINASKWLFTTMGDVPVSNLARRKRRLDRAMLAELRKADPSAQLTPWRLHYLRHTLKTWMQRARIPKDIRNAVQNHYDGDMDELYGHYTFEKEKRDALERWAHHIDAVVSGNSAKVVPLRAAE